MIIDKELLDRLFDKACVNPRLRVNFDLRTTTDDGSQRMLNAMQPGTVCAIHKHEDTSETVICICGRMDEVFYEEVVEYSNDDTSRTKDIVRERKFKEIERIHLCPSEGNYGCQVPKGMWHNVEVIEPSVIFEAKDKAYGADGSIIGV